MESERADARIENNSTNIAELNDDVQLLKQEVAKVVTLGERLERVENDFAILESEKMAPTAEKKELPSLNLTEEDLVTSPNNIGQDSVSSDARSVAEEVATTAASNSTDVIIDYVNDQVSKLRKEFVTENRLVPIIERLDRLETDFAYVESETTGLMKSKIVAPVATTVPVASTIMTVKNAPITEKTIEKVDSVMKIISATNRNNVVINLNGVLFASRRVEEDTTIFNLHI